MEILKQIKDRVQGKAPAGAKRSSKWPKIRAEHLAKNGECAVCGGKQKLEVHHIAPFHVDPTKELDLANLITLCESGTGGVTCHLHFGHLGNYKKTNPDVAKDAAIWKQKLGK